MKMILVMLLGSLMLSAMDDEQPNNKKIYLTRCSKQEIVDALAKNPHQLAMEIAWLKQEDIGELVDAVRVNESMEELIIDLCGEFRVPININDFWAAFAEHKALKKLTIRFGVMKEEMAQGVPHFTGIEEFVVQNLEIPPEHVDKVARFITKNPLKKFILKQSTIKDLGGPVLLDALKDHANLEEVFLDSNIVYVSLDRVCDTLSSLKKVRHVSFHQHGLDGEQLGFLAQGIDNKIPFVAISVTDCKAKDKFSQFMTSIQGCNSLHSFRVQGKFNKKNIDGTQAIQEILQAVASNKNIKFLSLAENSLSYEQLGCVIEFIKTNSSVQSLDLSFCRIQLAGINEILMALNNNFSLTQLNRLGNNYAAHGCNINEVKKIDQRLDNYMQRNNKFITILAQPMKDTRILEIACCAQDLPNEVLALLYRWVIILHVDKEYATKGNL